MKQSVKKALGRAILVFAVACGSRPPSGRPCEGGNLVESGGWKIMASDDGRRGALNIFERSNSPTFWEWAIAGKVIHFYFQHLERPWMVVPIEGGPAKAEDGILQVDEWERIEALSSDPGWYYLLDISGRYYYESKPESLPLEVCRDNEGRIYWRTVVPEQALPSTKERR